MLYVPFINDGSTVGGPITFMHYLHNFLLSQNVPFAMDSDFSNVTAIFFPIAFDLVRLKELKQKGCKIIQRLDGIYYPSKHGEDYLELNSEIKEIYCDLADHVIFQSLYSQKQCTVHFGQPKSFSIVTNGVDKDLFEPNLDVNFNKQDPLKFITTGNFRNIDMLEPLIQALDLLVDKGILLELTIVGPITTHAVVNYLDRPYIHHVGKQPLNVVAKYLHQSQIFLYSHLNPPCPNSVLEAISVGLPVVGFDSGAMSELLFWQKDLLAEVSDDTFQKYEDFHVEKLVEKIMLSVRTWPIVKKRALEHSYLYSFSECGSQYLKVFQSLL